MLPQSYRSRLHPKESSGRAQDVDVCDASWCLLTYSHGNHMTCQDNHLLLDIARIIQPSYPFQKYNMALADTIVIRARSDVKTAPTMCDGFTMTVGRM